jgi:hypothetical protein
MSDNFMIGENHSYVTAFSKMDMLHAVDYAYKKGYEIDFESPYTGTIGFSQIKVMLKEKEESGREKKIRAILLDVLKERIPGLDARTCKTVDNCLSKFEELSNAKSNGQTDIQAGGDDAETETPDSDST